MTNPSQGRATTHLQLRAVTTALTAANAAAGLRGAGTQPRPGLRPSLSRVSRRSFSQGGRILRHKPSSRPSGLTRPHPGSGGLVDGMLDAEPDGGWTAQGSIRATPAGPSRWLPLRPRQRPAPGCDPPEALMAAHGTRQYSRSSLTFCRRGGGRTHLPVLKGGAGVDRAAPRGNCRACARPVDLLRGFTHGRPSSTIEAISVDGAAISIGQRAPKIRHQIELISPASGRRLSLRLADRVGHARKEAHANKFHLVARPIPPGQPQPAGNRTPRQSRKCWLGRQPTPNRSTLVGRRGQ